MLRLIYPSVLLWLCLPLALYACLSLFPYPLSQHKPTLLFALYISFSWGIAVLIFVIESARQQLFKKPVPFRAALRLGIYGVVVFILSLLASPNQTAIALAVKISIFIIVVSYGVISGYIYTRKNMPYRR